jgi:YgiT-type zinc finger domain-containing protein
MNVEMQCDVCHIGLLHPRRVTYAAQVGNNLLVLPGIQVFICDVCGESTYDPQTIARIEMLLGIDVTTSAPTRRVEAGSGHAAGETQRSTA